VSRAVGPGRGSLAGLAWLVGLGPAPVEAWGIAMGWAPSTTFSHAARLIAAGLADSCRLRHGDGSLIYATRSGVEVSGAFAPALPGEPAPTTWAHLEACAWTAAWLTARGRHVIGSRALLLDDGWKGQLEWLERDGLRRRAHRPDLVTGQRADGRLLPVEVELSSKSLRRLRAILGLHVAWIAAGKTSAAIYVCGPSELAERVRREAAEFGLTGERKTLRVELLATVIAAARATRLGAEPGQATLVSGGVA
jgi:hypothetical protein